MQHEIEQWPFPSNNKYIHVNTNSVLSDCRETMCHSLYERDYASDDDAYVYLGIDECKHRVCLFVEDLFEHLHMHTESWCPPHTYAYMLMDRFCQSIHDRGEEYDYMECYLPESVLKQLAEECDAMFNSE